MPNFIVEVLLVWNYRSRSLWLITFGFISIWLIPAFIDWYWTKVELDGIFAGFENLFAEAQHGKYDKRGFYLAVVCWVAAYKTFKKDRKKLMHSL